MSGHATFSGTDFQARVIAYIYVHILGERRLGWLGPTNDIPISVAAETSGPGDDARVEFGAAHEPIEVQAKHGLTAGSKLTEVFQRVDKFSKQGKRADVILAVDPSASNTVRADLALDLDRLRAGRYDSLKQVTMSLCDQVGDNKRALELIRVVTLDVCGPGGAGLKFACEILRGRLRDPQQAEAAWSGLVADASVICARRLARNQKDLAELVGGMGIELRPRTTDEKWEHALDSSRALLESHESQAALALLEQYEKGLAAVIVGPRLRYRFAQQRAAAFLQLGKYPEALNWSQRAMEFDPEGVHALVTGAFAAMFMGESQAAEEYANRAVAAAPGEARAWGCLAQVASYCDLATAQPPASIAEDDLYRTALAQVAANRGEWQTVLDLTGSLLQGGKRALDVAFLRTRAHLSLGLEPGLTHSRQHLLEAERLACELLESAPSNAHPYVRQGLLLRATARQALGDSTGECEDLTRAREMAPEDAEIIFQYAMSKAREGDAQAALDALQAPSVGRDVMLLALRAEVLGDLRDLARARQDFETARNLLSETPDRDAARLLLAETAITLKELSAAAELLEPVSIKSPSKGYALVLQGRLAFEHSAISEAVALYRDAVARNPDHRAEWLAELGSKLVEAAEPQQAVAVFEEIEWDSIPTGALPQYGRALLRANQLVGAHDLIDRLSRVGPVPDWALDLAAKLAVLQEDAESAATFLTGLVKRGAPSRAARAQLAACLVEIGRESEARIYLEALADEEGFPPIERIQIAQLLLAAGEPKRAVGLAFRAFRDGQGDPNVHRAFVATVFMSRIAPDQPQEVGPDTHVRLANAEDEVREHTIYADPPIDPLRREMSLEDARAAGLLGKRKGESVIVNEASWREKRWVVEQITSAVVFAFNDAIRGFEERFPGEPFFVWGFHVGPEPTLKDLAPIVATLEERKAQMMVVSAYYRTHLPPLGILAHLICASVPDAMAVASGETEAPGLLIVESPRRQEQELGVRAAFRATDVVVTRSALQTLAGLGLLDQLAATFHVIAPRSLPDELRRELEDAERRVLEGQSAIASAGPGLALVQLEAGDPILVKHRDRAKKLMTWLTGAATLEPRPLDTIHPIGSQEEQSRRVLGRSSFDSLALAQRGPSLYADDFGLRRLLSGDASGQSFSTISLLGAFVKRGVLSSGERDGHLLALLRHRFAFLLPTVGILALALRQAEAMLHSDLEFCFDLLAGPGMSPREASLVAAQLVRFVAIEPIQSSPLAAVVTHCLLSMSKRWPRELCSFFVLQAAEEELALLPRDLRVVHTVCRSFNQGKVPAVGLSGSN